MTNIDKQTHCKQIAELVGCSPAMVTRVVNGDRSANTKLGRKIKYAHRVYVENLEKAKKIIQNYLPEE